MSIIIRLQNLSWSANSLDIRRYFQGLSIPEGGVHIVGGEKGDAFIAFGTDEDARQAMEKDGGKLKDTKIKLLLSSRAEMQRVIEQARNQAMIPQVVALASSSPPQATPKEVPSNNRDQERSKKSPEKRRSDRSSREKSRDRERSSKKSSRRSRSRSPRRSRDKDRDKDRDSDRRSKRDERRKSEERSRPKEDSPRAETENSKRSNNSTPKSETPTTTTSEPLFPAARNVPQIESKGPPFALPVNSDQKLESPWNNNFPSALGAILSGTNDPSKHIDNTLTSMRPGFPLVTDLFNRNSNIELGKGRFSDIPFDSKVLAPTPTIQGNYSGMQFDMTLSSVATAGAGSNSAGLSDPRGGSDFRGLPGSMFLNNRTSAGATGTLGNPGMNDVGLQGSRLMSDTGLQANSPNQGIGSFGNAPNQGIGGFGNALSQGVGNFGNAQNQVMGGFGNTPNQGVGGFRNMSNQGVGSFGNNQSQGTGGFGSNPSEGVGGFGISSQVVGSFRNTQSQGTGSFGTTSNLGAGSFGINVNQGNFVSSLLPSMRTISDSRAIDDPRTVGTTTEMSGLRNRGILDPRIMTESRAFNESRGISDLGINSRGIPDMRGATNTREISDPRGMRDSIDLLDRRGVRDAREIADPRGVRDSREFQDPRGIREPRDMADPRSIRDNRDMPDQRGMRDNRDIPDNRRPRDSKEFSEHRGTKDNREDHRSVRDNREQSDHRTTRDNRDTSDQRGSRDNRDVSDHRGIRDSRNTEQRGTRDRSDRGTRDNKDASAQRGSRDKREVSDPRSARESREKSDKTGTSKPVDMDISPVRGSDNRSDEKLQNSSRKEPIEITLDDKNEDEQKTCLEMRGLPPFVVYKDIRDFFRGISIPSDGIKIINNEKGQRTGVAYIRLNSEKDATAAQKRTGNRMESYPVDLSCVAFRVFDDAIDSFLPPGMKKPASYSKPREPERLDACLLVRGLPYECKQSDITDFFRGIKISDMFLEHDVIGRTKGTAFVEFSSVDDLRQALTRSGKTIGRRYIELSPVTRDTMQSARPKDIPDVPVPPPRNTEPLITNCIFVTGLPHTVVDRQVADFFGTVGYIPHAIHMMLGPNGAPTGDAYVEFNNPKECELGLKRNGHLLGSKPVQLAPISYKDMMNVLNGTNKSEPDIKNDPIVPITDGTRNVHVGKPGLNAAYQNLPRGQMDNSQGYPDPALHSDGPRGYSDGPRGYSDGPRSYPGGNRPDGFRDSPTGPRGLLDGSRGLSEGPASLLHGSRGMGDGPRSMAEGPRGPRNNFGHPDNYPAQSDNMGSFQPHREGRGMPDKFGGRPLMDEMGDHGRAPLLDPRNRTIMPDSRRPMREGPHGNFDDSKMMMEDMGRPALGDVSRQRRNMDGPPNGRSMMDIDDSSYMEDKSSNRMFDDPRYQDQEMFDDHRFASMRGKGPAPYRGRGGGPPMGGRPPPPPGQGVENFGQPGCVVGATNIPFRATIEDILTFLVGYGLSPDNIIRRYAPNGRVTGDARINFRTPEDAQRALSELNGLPIWGRAVTLFAV